MLLKLLTLSVENQGYKREVTSKPLYVNPSNIVSISDHSGVEDFLKSEGLEHSDKRFCVVRLSHGHKTEEIVVFGSSEEIFSQIEESQIGKRILLNG